MHNFYLWYIPREKKYFQQNHDAYDGFAIGAHILSHYKNAFTQILDETHKQYFIDPETSLFQHSSLDIFFNDKNQIRSSWENLFQYYPHFIQNILLTGRLLTVTDFKNLNGTYKPELTQLLTSVLNYQNSIIPQTTQGFARLLGVQPVNNLAFLTLPYFYFSSIDDPWYEINKEILNQSENYNYPLNKFAVICTSKNGIYRNLDQIADDYLASNVDGYLIWIDEFDEMNESSDFLELFIQLVHRLSSQGRSVLNLYGEYFSTLLSYWGMAGHVTGVGYRMSRGVYNRPATGGPAGGPTPQYYIPPFHSRVTLEQGIRLIGQYPNLACTCPYCTSHPEVYDANTSRGDRRFIMNQHFLYNRRLEVDEVNSATYAAVLTNLEQIRNLYRSQMPLLQVDHIDNWWTAIENSVGLLP